MGGLTMGNRHIRLGSSLLLLCLIGLLGLQRAFFTSQAQPTGWEDDFSDGNYNGWMITGAIHTGTEYVLATGNFSAAGGTLLCTGPNLNVAFYDSSVANGTWSFDVLAVMGLARFIMIIFVGDNYNINDYVSNGYMLTIGLGNYGGYVDPTFIFEERDNSQWIEHDHWTTTRLEGWQHIRITRDTTGLFNIFINNTLRMSKTDDTMITSVYFYFICQEGQALDNVKVSPIIETQPPIHGFPFITIFIAITLAVGVAIVWRRNRNR